MINLSEYFVTRITSSCKTDAAGATIKHIQSLYPIVQPQLQGFPSLPSKERGPQPGWETYGGCSSLYISTELYNFRWVLQSGKKQLFKYYGSSFPRFCQPGAVGGFWPDSHYRRQLLKISVSAHLRISFPLLKIPLPFFHPLLHRIPSFIHPAPRPRTRILGSA